MVSYRIVCVCFLLLLQNAVFGQINRYMVFFNDKAGTPFTIENPSEFLSQRSIDRRAKHQFNITEQDLPVNPSSVSAISTAGADVYFTSRWMNAALVTMNTSLVATIEGLSIVNRVEYIGPGEVLSRTEIPVTVPDVFLDPPAVHATSEVQNSMIGADQLRGWGAVGTDILVAVFDGGFEGVNEHSPFEHLFSQNKIIAELDFVRNSGNPYQYSNHGTRVLSCIAGYYPPDFTGTAPDVEVIIAVTEEVETPSGQDSEYRVEEYNWLLAAEFADSAGVDIINSSLSYYSFIDESMDYDYAEMDGQTTVIAQAANLAFERGILIVSSQGNSGGDGDSESTFESCNAVKEWCYMGSPADSPNVLAVGAVYDNETRVYFSSFGPTSDGRTKPDVAAMGWSTSSVQGNGFISGSFGTSFSAPLISGYAASLMQAYPELTNAELMALLRDSGSQTDNPDNELGYGIPRFLHISNELGTPYLLQSDNPEPIKAFPNPFESNIYFENLVNENSYRVINIKGQTIGMGVISPYQNTISIDSSLPAGVYFLQISGYINETIKLLKK